MIGQRRSIAINTLVILTEAFPYTASSEAFFEAEQGYSTRYFDRVFIFPLRYMSDTDKSTLRVVDSNITVVQLFDHENASKLSTFSAAIHSPLLGGELSVLLSAGEPITARVKAATGFVGRAELYFERINSFLVKHCAGDEITVYSYWLYVHALTGLLLKRRNNDVVKAVSRAHGFDLYEERSPTSYLPLRLALLNGLDVVFPISQNGANYLMEHYAPFKADLRVSRLGTYDHGIGPAAKAETPFHIVTCSGMIPLKRLSLLVAALSRTKNSILWTHFGDGPLREEVEEQARLLPSSVKVEFRGFRPNQEVLAYYEREPVDLFINVSSSEGVPVSIMEALSFGIPVLATAVGGTPELVETGMNGILLNANPTPEEIASALEEITAMDKSLIRHNARITWEGKADAAVTYPRFYEQLLAR